jgi:hemerythrin-like domain-containing protein
MRAIIIYDVVSLRLAKQQETEPSAILKTTAVIHHYLQDFHENMEERFIFKPMEQAHIEFSSIQELKVQHGTGHELIARITQLAKTGKLGPELAGYLDSFGRMYRYHAAWEDTVVFPAFDAMERRNELAELAGTFELEEKSILGDTGFESFVGDIAGVEKQLAIYDLAKWTAKL